MKWAFSDGDHEKYREMVARLDLGLEDRLGTRIDLLSRGAAPSSDTVDGDTEKAGYSSP